MIRADTQKDEEEERKQEEQREEQVQVSEKNKCGALKLPTIVFSQFAGTALWFAPNAVISQVEGFGSRELATLTSLVQAGFIVGTFVFTFFAVADRFSPPAVFCLMCLAGSASNALCITTTNFAVWCILRSLVGFSLAGVYPLGMKIAANEYPNGLGVRLGVLVGALTFGTAFPWLIRGIGDQSAGLPFETTLVFVSVLALLGGLLMPLMLIPAGLHRDAFRTLCCGKSNETHTAGIQFGWPTIRMIMSQKSFRSAAMGYWGHMWELYAFWAFLPVLAEAHERITGDRVLNVSLTSFAGIAIGAISSCLAGVWSIHSSGKRIPGSALVATLSLILSGLCCFIVPAYKHMSSVGFFAFVLVWGFAVVADSAQFSSLCAMFAPSQLVGTALTLTTCVGFTITIVSIQLVGQLIKHGVDPGWALFCLSPGPVIGVAFAYKQWPIHRTCLSVDAASQEGSFA